MFALLRFNQLTHNVVWAQLFNFGLLATNASFHKLFTTAGEDFPASHPHHTQRAGCQGLTRQTPDQTLLRKKKNEQRIARIDRSVRRIKCYRPDQSFPQNSNPNWGRIDVLASVENWGKICSKLGELALDYSRRRAQSALCFH